MLLLRLPAQLSIRFNCDIIPIYISRDKKNNFEMEILNPLIFPENRKKDKVYIKKKINEKIEQLIIRDPSQWILTHNRWK